MSQIIAFSSNCKIKMPRNIVFRLNRKEKCREIQKLFKNLAKLKCRKNFFPKRIRNFEISRSTTSTKLPFYVPNRNKLKTLWGVWGQSDPPFMINSKMFFLEREWNPVFFCDFYCYYNSRLSWKFHWNSSSCSEDMKIFPATVFNWFFAFPCCK